MPQPMDDALRRCIEAFKSALTAVQGGTGPQAEGDVARQEELKTLLVQLEELETLPPDVVGDEVSWMKDAALSAEFFANQTTGNSGTPSRPPEATPQFSLCVDLLREHLQHMQGVVARFKQSEIVPEPAEPEVPQTSSIQYDPTIHKTVDQVFRPYLACVACEGQRQCLWPTPGQRCSYCAKRAEACYVMYNNVKTSVRDFCHAASQENKSFVPKQTRQSKGRAEAVAELSDVTRGAMAQRLARELALTTITFEKVVEQRDGFITQAHRIQRVFADVEPSATALAVWAGSASPLPSSLTEHMLVHAAHPDRDIEMEN
ncbi:hypothetical protein AURDEDRAFT_124841 [Auricularia subglabra TFB-10046 SS5]|nr:hypothetical protein AURDEDRAFT_124841 [Auricularia subglabra TFB-10046 SS5]